jgi:membrane-associated protease RseP (regulator of RpoE activity)
MHDIPDEAPNDRDGSASDSKPNPPDDTIINWLSEPVSADSNAPQVYEAQLVPDPAPVRVRRRRRWLPLSLFLLTCVSTFIAGVCRWVPTNYITYDLTPLRQDLIGRWDEGLVYMACVLAILLTHEMGHFIATVWHRIPASYPFFLPLPVSPLGTLGAVIGMDGLRANRRQMFDIGIAGPLAGLVVAVPILLIGVGQLDFDTPQSGPFRLDNPLAVRALLWFHQPAGYEQGAPIWHSQLNPFFMAGWVGLLITGLNMLPVSQLDGGHVTYTLFGKSAHWIARIFMLGAVAWVFLSGHLAFVVMIFLIMLVGTDHPPTSDDRMSLGWFRTTLGCISLIIPLVCFAPRAIY